MNAYQWRHLVIREYPERQIITIVDTRGGQRKTIDIVKTIPEAVAAFKARMR